MPHSYSQIATFQSCPLKYRYRYVDKIRTPTETIEAFMGTRVHEVLERLHSDVHFTRVPSLESLLERFAHQWARRWHEDVIIVAAGRTPEDYRELGKRCIGDYYRRHHPFDEDRMLGVEMRVEVPLDDAGEYRLLGFVDRLARAPDGVVVIHDYKTSSRLRTQAEVDQDVQLALYELAVRRIFPRTTQVRLAWHFLAFDEILVSTRTAEDLAGLRRWAIERVQELRKGPYPARVSGLCSWCEYRPICPEWRHLYGLKTLPEGERTGDEGVVLVDRVLLYSRLRKRIDRKYHSAQRALVAYARRHGLERVFGPSAIARVTRTPRLAFPTKGEEPEARRALEDLVRKSGRWDEVSDLNTHTLARLLTTGEWEGPFAEPIRATARVVVDERVYLSRADEPEEDQEAGPPVPEQLSLFSGRRSRG